MIKVPEIFQPQINVVYPPNNFVEFERWFGEKYNGCNTDRVYIKIYWCGYQVNNNYGNDLVSMKALQYFVDTLPNDLKYFTISQYDNGVGVDWKGKDVLEFNMSKTGGNMYPLPLIGQPHPYVFNEEKKYIANFVGGLTHPIREHAKTLIGKEGYYISFDRHSPEDYCRIIAQSIFTLCYRGFGLNSFRISEALQYGSIPVYISDEFIEPHNIDINEYGYKINESDLHKLQEILKGELPFVSKLSSVLQCYYEQYFTYEGCYNKIINYLENDN